MDIVEIEGTPIAKRGKKSGLKQLWKCDECGKRYQTLSTSRDLTCPICNSEVHGLLKKRYADGHKLIPDPTPRQIRAWVLEQLNLTEL